MKSLRTLLFVASLTGLLVTQSGCLLAVAAVGTGATVAYVKGDSEVIVEADPKQIASATEKAMKDLEMPVISNYSSSLSAKIVGRTMSDKRMEVEVKSYGAKASKVSIRAGVFGDEALQARLLDKIKSNLGEASDSPSSVASETQSKSASAGRTNPTTAPVITSAHESEPDPRD